MKTKTLFRLCGGFLLALGVPTLLVAQWGSLWQPGTVEYLGWLQLYVLRPMMYGVGTVATGLGLWHLWIRWTTFGYVLRSWAEACQWERDMDRLYAAQLAPEGYGRRGFGADLHHLWYLVTHCAIGSHDPNALWYSDGGEDGPRGTTCGDCGVRISLQNVTARAFPLTVADYQRVDMAFLEQDGGPDPLRSISPDDGCYTQGSDAVVRANRCDKEG
jgi:hypothetical protein